MRFRTQIAMGISDTAELCLKNGGILLAKSIACSFMALTATKEQLLFGKGGLSQPIVARRGSPGDFANSIRRFLIHSAKGMESVPQWLQPHLTGQTPRVHYTGRLPAEVTLVRRQDSIAFKPVSQKPQAVQQHDALISPLHQGQRMKPMR